MGKKIFVIADWIAFGIVPITLLFIVLSLGNSTPFALFGKVAKTVLLIILFMKPILMIVGYKPLLQLIPYRRQLGMITFWFALFHAGGILINNNFFSLQLLFSNIFKNALSRWVLSITGILFLGATTNFYSQRKLGKNWKRIQSLAYPVLFLVLLHAQLIQLGREKEGTVLGAWMLILILLAVFLFLKYRQKKVMKKEWPSLVQMIWSKSA